MDHAQRQGAHQEVRSLKERRGPALAPLVGALPGKRLELVRVWRISGKDVIKIGFTNELELRVVHGAQREHVAERRDEVVSLRVEAIELRVERLEHMQQQRRGHHRRSCELLLQPLKCIDPSLREVRALRALRGERVRRVAEALLGLDALHSEVRALHGRFSGRKCGALVRSRGILVRLALPLCSSLRLAALLVEDLRVVGIEHAARHRRERERERGGGGCSDLAESRATGPEWNVKALS